MRKEIQIICVGNPEFGDCGEALGAGQFIGVTGKVVAAPSRA